VLIVLTPPRAEPINFHLGKVLEGIKNMEHTLDRRSREVLRAVIHAHISTGEPVGSRTIAKKYGLGVSPATIRNVMADLEEMGFLTHPHTSAGRIPTDKGFRFYVNELMSEKKATPAFLQDQLSQLQNLLLREDLNPSEVLVEACRILSRISNHMGLVFIPTLRTSRFHHIQFVPLTPRKVLAVIISEGGMIQHKTVTLEDEITPQELEKYGKLLNQEFAGKGLMEVRKALLEAMERDIREYDTLYTKALQMARKALETMEDEGLIHVEGTSNILSHKEFIENVERMKGLFKAFEEKSKVVKLLDRCLESEDIVVTIGSETEIEELQDLSLVASSCRVGDRIIGGLGIMGPKRMDYAYVLPLMRETAQLINTILTV